MYRQRQPASAAAALPERHALHNHTHLCTYITVYIYRTYQCCKTLRCHRRHSQSAKLDGSQALHARAAHEQANLPQKDSAVFGHVSAAVAATLRERLRLRFRLFWFQLRLGPNLLRKITATTIATTTNLIHAIWEKNGSKPSNVWVHILVVAAASDNLIQNWQNLRSI